VLLNEIQLVLPKLGTDFESGLIKFLGAFGEVDGESVTFAKSDEKLMPTMKLAVGDVDVPKADFHAGEENSIDIVNTTGQERQSPYQYRYLELDEFMRRIGQYDLTYLDHIGFDLPWFNGVHPEIIKLREKLTNKWLYYLYPTGENWDFVIPGTDDEIVSKNINYKIIRRPKFEIVSIDYVSKPLIQFDFRVDAKYEKIVKLFPEAIPDDFNKNVWIYLKNPYDIDICFVVGKSYKLDWYKFIYWSIIILENMLEGGYNAQSRKSPGNISENGL